MQVKPDRCVRGLAVLTLCLGTAGTRAETDRSSTYQFRYEESLKANQADQPQAFTPHRAPPTFRRILMQRAADPRSPADRQFRQAVLPAQPVQMAVFVYGDRFGQALAAGLEDDGSSSVAVTAITSDDAGLCRTDFGDWLQSIRARLARPDRPAVAIMMLGSNDRQALPDGSASVAPSNPRWPALYASRVDAVAAAFDSAHVPLIWVGLPSVHSEDISADFVRLNGIVRDRMAQHGATYVDSWEAFNDETGRYSPVGPDVEGEAVKLRKAEGFGFTHAGARKLASFVEADLKRLRTLPGSPNTGAATDITIETTGDFDQALQIDVNAQIRREAGLTPDAPSAAGPGLPVGPAAGPVLPLTAPPLSPNGQLAGSPPSGGPVASLDALAQPSAPKPGRADDFAWPKP